VSEGAGKAQEKRKIQAIKGVRDILPPETALWNRVEQTAREVFTTYGFGEIRLPIFEPTELFARSIGEETDVVAKVMYTFDVVEPELARLDAFRRYVAMTDVTSANPQTLDSLHEELRKFLGELSDTRVGARLAENPINSALISRLWHGLQQLPLLKDAERGTMYQESFDSIVQGIRHAAEYLQLGERTTLRPEATASVCRAYIEHGMHTLPGNVKLYYMGPMFRRERPQKGRYRQFYQIGAEVLSQSDDLKSLARIDAELIEMLVAFFEKAGLEGTTLYLNSIGCKDCRPKYVELLRAELMKVKGELEEDSKRRMETNPLRVLDSKLESEQAIIEKLPHIADHLCGPCREQYAEVKQQLALRNIKYQENWRLVRGLDYYVRTTFEITSPGLGSQNAVCGGGRYDGLVELLGGPPTKGIGFAIGTDRVILSLQDMRKLPEERALDVYVTWMGEKSYPAAVKIARRLREAGIAVELPAGEMKFGKALGLADKLGARFAVILGEDEVASRQFTVKRLEDGEQKKMGEGELVEYFKTRGNS
jgi:histidyl-tRNA synthetase